MPDRVNDPRDLQAWMAQCERRLRALETRRIDPGDGVSLDYATKTMSARISQDTGNAATLGEDGGIYAESGIQSIEDHTPLYIQFGKTAGQSIPTGNDTVVSWDTVESTGNWTSSATTATIPEDGRYHISFTWQWANTTTATLRGLKITVNSTAPGTSSIFSNTMLAIAVGGVGKETAHGISEYETFVAGDVIRAYVYHEHGVNLSGGGPYFSDIRGRLTIVKVHDAFPPTLTN